MIEEIKYFILGLIQGVTEFFPISSSGHLELYSHVASIAKEQPLLLFIIVHFATALSTIVIYHNRIKKIFLGIVKDQNKKDISFCLKIIVSSIPTMMAYLLLNNYIEDLFYNSTQLVSIMLILTGVLLIFTNFFKRQNKEITFLKAIFIGCAQALAIIPGISRSGTTIFTALYFNIKREDATEFAFLMALVPIIGGAIIKMVELSISGVIYEIETTGLIIAFFSAFFSGLLACKYMIQIVQKNNLKYFGYYCIIVGIAFLIIFYV